jgi:hypothetical protein
VNVGLDLTSDLGLAVGTQGGVLEEVERVGDEVSDGEPVEATGGSRGGTHNAAPLAQDLFELPTRWNQYMVICTRQRGTHSITEALCEGIVEEEDDALEQVWVVEVALFPAFLGRGAHLLLHGVNGSSLGVVRGEDEAGRTREATRRKA